MVWPRALRPFAALLGAALIAATLLAGCGDDGGDETVTVTESAPAETATAPAETDTGTAATTTTARPQGDHGPRAFRSPSGNIGCYLDSTGARCDIAERSWEPPPPDQPCELDYGQGIGLDADGAAFVCAGDTTLGAGATLAYGSSARRGSFLCESAEAGITCTDTASGRGFTLSREAYEIF
ncbi:MAG: DUF6636 domain-containing protein [Solirubrobacterales bacterium]